MAAWIIIALVSVALLCALAVLFALVLSRRVNNENIALLEEPIRAPEPEQAEEPQPLNPEAP